MLKEWFMRIRFLVFPKPYDEIDEELQFHIEQQTAANVEQGMTPVEARRQALIALGGIEGVREQSHAQRPRIRFEILLQDFRYALRQMRRAPGFSLGVIAVLALGIGANAAMFTVLERTLFRPLVGTPIRTIDQIVEDSMGSQLLAAHLLEALGGLALLVALAGLYSLLTYFIALRKRELGLRLALGAQRSDILLLVLESAGVLLIVGTAIGVGISLLTAHLIQSMLFGVKQYDVLTLIAAPALLLLV